MLSYVQLICVAEMFLGENLIFAFEFYKCIIDASNGILDRFWIKIELTRTAPLRAHSDFDYFYMVGKAMSCRSGM
jgi:hypothetical protein